ncbi:hypothetical protein [Telmatospirillum sp.]|uniref:hypothetical protein n=1 Tax=Telmatospirillum sp. TaxID=2079197 RepID=UPI00284C46A2|nr:hypothetical protein [Telmatospirillum sp.]MDR3436392.1 hypothetical protein [Telmatospirillum sp.]
MNLEEFKNVFDTWGEKETRRPFLTGVWATSVVLIAIFGGISSFLFFSHNVEWQPPEQRNYQKEITNQEATIAELQDKYHQAVATGEELSRRANDTSEKCGEAIRAYDKAQTNVRDLSTTITALKQSLSKCETNLGITNEIGLKECNKNAIWDFSKYEPHPMKIQEGSFDGLRFGGNAVMFSYKKAAKGRAILELQDNGQHFDLPMEQGREYCVISPSAYIKMRAESIYKEWDDNKVDLVISMKPSPYRE